MLRPRVEEVGRRVLGPDGEDAAGDIAEGDEKQLQVCDVLNTMAPVRVFDGHRAPVCAIDWGRVEANIFVTVGQDKTVVWDDATGKVVL